MTDLAPVFVAVWCALWGLAYVVGPVMVLLYREELEDISHD